MNDITDRPTKSLSSQGGVVKDVKWLFQSSCTAEDLQSFREKSWAQHNAGLSVRDTVLDRDIDKDQ